jgi:DNA-binding NtrC family response regulator
MSEVLILEDDTFSALALSSLLEAEGHSVSYFSSSEVALESGCSRVPDVLVADWSVDGSVASADVARQFRRINPAMRVVFVTGHDIKDIKARVCDLEPCDVLSKPLDFDLFLATVRSSEELRSKDWLRPESFIRLA